MSDFLNIGFDLKAITNAAPSKEPADFMSAVKNTRANNTDEQIDNHFEKKLNDKQEEIQDDEENTDKHRTKLKNKLENLNDAIGLVIATLTNTPANKQDTEQLATSVNATDTEIAAIKMATVLDHKIETTIKAIAGIDLNQEDAIKDILALSDRLEGLNDLKASLQVSLTKLNVDEKQENPNLEPELNILLESRVENFIESYVENKLDTKDFNTESQDTDILMESINLTVHQETDTPDSSGKNQEQNANSFETANELFMLGKTTVDATSQSPSSFKTHVVKETVDINKLDTYLNDKLHQLPSGKKETIELTLTPDEFGEVKLSIARHGEKLEIKMVFANQEGLDSVENKLEELQASLKAKGFEAEIKVSTDNSSSNLGSNTQGQPNASFNEARDEQKEKLLNTAPAWLKAQEPNHKASFEQTLGGILS